MVLDGALLRIAAKLVPPPIIEIRQELSIQALDVVIAEERDEVSIDRADVALRARHRAGLVRLGLKLLDRDLGHLCELLRPRREVVLRLQLDFDQRFQRLRARLPEAAASRRLSVPLTARKLHLEAEILGARTAIKPSVVAIDLDGQFVVLALHGPLLVGRVRAAGLEPASHRRQILSLMWLPVSPRPHVTMAQSTVAALCHGCASMSMTTNYLNHKDISL